MLAIVAAVGDADNTSDTRGKTLTNSLRESPARVTGVTASMVERTHNLVNLPSGQGSSSVASFQPDRFADRIRRTVNFTLRDGAAEISCCVTFEALQRLSRVSGNVAEIAEQLFDRHRREIEPIALARYAAGDFTDGVVRLDVNDFPRPAIVR